MEDRLVHKFHMIARNKNDIYVGLLDADVNKDSLNSKEINDLLTYFAPNGAELKSISHPNEDEILTAMRPQKRKLRLLKPSKENYPGGIIKLSY